MSKGYWIAFCGVALFAASLSLAPVLHLSAATAALLTGGAVLALVLGFVLGTLYIGVEKGYPIGLTLILGFLPLLGLLIAAMLPYRRSRA
jgi:hypothetical protein